MSTSRRRGRPPSPEVAAKREQLREAIRSFRAQGNTAPTIPELMRATGLTRAMVRNHLAALVAEGRLQLGQLRRELILLEDGDADEG